MTRQGIRHIVRVGMAVLVVVLSFPAWMSGQEVRTDTLDPERVHIFHADRLYGNDEGPEALRRMTGDVVLFQDSSFFYCDTAVMVGQLVNAWGNILIQQGDSLRLYADSLAYNGSTREARLFGKVVLDHKGRRLFTDTLVYDLKEKVARYETGGLLIAETTRLRSRVGFYRVRSELAYFRDSVQVVDDQFELSADSLYFMADIQRALFAGPTLIDQEGRKIYCEDGFYDVPSGKAEFLTNARYRSSTERVRADSIRVFQKTNEVILSGRAFFKDEKQEASADYIYHNDSTDITELKGNAFFTNKEKQVQGPWIFYNGKTGEIRTRGRTMLTDSVSALIAESIDYDDERGIGIAVGRVRYVDSVGKWALEADSVLYKDREEYIKAMGVRRPIMQIDMEGDTMHICADTILSYRDTTTLDSSRMMLAYNDVRIYKSDLQGLSDSLAYREVDSVFRFFGQPMMWSDTSQFEGDTILLTLRDKKVDKMFLRLNAFMVQSPDLQFFNQIKGRWITAFFAANEVDKLHVEGNAESIYYGQDDDEAYIGVNQSESSSFWVYFHNKQVDRIVFLQKPKASLIPMKDAMANPPVLEGYRWVEDVRPSGVGDLR